MDINYFKKINNLHNSKSKQETDLYLLNKYVDECFDETIDYHVVKRNGEDFELIIVKDKELFKKKIKSKHSSPFNLGDYITWNNQVWIVDSIDTDEKTYHVGYMSLCTVVLRWQNSNLDIIERFSYSDDFANYTGNGQTITVVNDKYDLIIPIDEETKKLKRDMRFTIDFDESEIPDVYKLTNRNVSSNNMSYFGRGGIINLTMSFDAFNSNTDKKVTLDNGMNVWVCNYSSTPTSIVDTNEDTNLTATISENKNLKVGYPRTYTVSFTDVNGNIVDDTIFTWNVVSDFDVQQTIDENKITLLVSNENYIGKFFLLQVLNGADILAEMTIYVEEAF